MEPKAALAGLLARRLQPPPPQAVPTWRREELWRTDPAAAATLLEAGHSFAYEFERSSAAPLSPPQQITLPESHDQVGCRVWDGAVLAGKLLERAVADGRLDLRGAAVLELGAGTGLVGLVAAALGDDATRVALTDVPALVPQLRENVERNGVRPRALAAPLTWGVDADADAAVGALQEAGAPPLPLLLASDMAAPVKHVPDFLTSLLRLLPPSGVASASSELSAAVRAAIDAAASATAEFSPEAYPLLQPSAATPQQLLPRPCLLLVAQHHREFTAPLLAGCAAAGYTVARLPPDEWLHPAYRSPRHTVFVVAPQQHVGG